MMLKKYDKQRNQLLRATGIEKDYRKMYKAGKNWLIASIAAVSFGAMTFAAPVVSGNTVSASETTPQTQQVDVAAKRQSAAADNGQSKQAAAVDQAGAEKTAAATKDTPVVSAPAQTTATSNPVNGQKADASDTTQSATPAPAKTSSDAGETVTPVNNAGNSATKRASTAVTATPESQQQTTQLNVATADQVKDAKTTAAANYAKTGVAQKVTASDPAVVTGTINEHFINQLTGQPITFHAESSDTSELVAGEKTFTTTATNPTGAYATDLRGYLIPVRGYQIETKLSDLPTKFKPGTTDVNINYLPLSDVVAQIVDQTTGKVLYQQVLPGKDQLGADPLKGEPADAYDVSYLKLDVPGFTYVSTDGNATGLFNQTQELTDPSKPYDATTNPIKPNAIVVQFNYKPNADNMTPTEADSSLIPIGTTGLGQIAATLPGYTDQHYDFTDQLNSMAQDYEKGGKTLIAIAGDPKGVMSIQGESLTYVFAKNIGVVVNYLDQTNNKVLQQVVLGNDGTIPIGDYQTEQKAFPGYTLVRVTGDAKGTYGPFGRVVTYYYTKNETPTTPTGPTNPWTPTTTTEPTTPVTPATPVTPTIPATTITPAAPATTTTPNETGLPNTFGGKDNKTPAGTHAQPNQPQLPRTFGQTSQPGAQNGHGQRNQQLAYGQKASRTVTDRQAVNGQPVATPTKQTTLPQTGDARSHATLLGGIGLAVVSVLGLLGLAERKRRMN